MYPHNARPTQPLHERVVKETLSVRPLDETSKRFRGSHCAFQLRQPARFEAGVYETSYELLKLPGRLTST